MAGSILKVPTPNEWLAELLAQLEISNTQLARMIGRDRTQVKRWVNGREQIPRHHLAEIAAHLGTPSDLDFAVKLKDCEDFSDSLRRRLEGLARVARCEADPLIESIQARLIQQTMDAEDTDPRDYLSRLLYNITHVSFVLRLWLESAENRSFGAILSPHNINVHLRYPANHFVGLLLNPKHIEGRLLDFRDDALRSMRSLALSRDITSPLELPAQHAIHMLARFGDRDHHDTVLDLISDSASSSDPLRLRLAFTGLMQVPGNQHLVDHYMALLHHNTDVAKVDTLFDALHYGDLKLGRDLQLPDRSSSYTYLTGNILRRLRDPDTYGVLQRLDLYRLSVLVNDFPEIVLPRMRTTISETLDTLDPDRQSDRSASERIRVISSRL
ncbi:helix-turn-helix domain-containing protein [Nocardia sp. NPDC059246]|uniref:helix-turn-helix domain-containing protein n=1 Tax=unclassified Nocardia TaxID=2637762 RepID=UPI0036C216CC